MCDLGRLPFTTRLTNEIKNNIFFKCGFRVYIKKYIEFYTGHTFLKVNMFLQPYFFNATFLVFEEPSLHLIRQCHWSTHLCPQGLTTLLEVKF